MDLENTLVGVAGEYLVAGELSLRGYLATITLRNSRGIDIIVSNRDATKSATVQVKTNSNGSRIWLLGKKSESYFAHNHFYVFVALAGAGERCRFHIVPSTVVADRVRVSHATWIAGKKIDGTERKNISLRKFIDKADDYLERWDLFPV